MQILKYKGMINSEQHMLPIKNNLQTNEKY